MQCADEIYKVVDTQHSVRAWRQWGPSAQFWCGKGALVHTFQREGVQVL